MLDYIAFIYYCMYSKNIHFDQLDSVFALQK